MGHKVGEIAMYDREVLRYCKCWRCVYRGEYEWRTSGYPDGWGPKIKNSKKCYCKKTKRWGSLERAYFCKYFIDNANG